MYAYVHVYVCPEAGCDQSAIASTWRSSPDTFQPCRRPEDVSCYMAAYDYEIFREDGQMRPIEHERRGTHKTLTRQEERAQLHPQPDP